MKDVPIKDNKKFKHIELGAGCGNFGMLYYPYCYLTDIDTTLTERCIECYIDVYCSAYQIPWPADRFEKVIICNPYRFGFSDEASAHRLLAELIRVLKANGEIIIIGHLTNKYCAPERVKRRIVSFANAEADLSITYGPVDSSIAYPQYIFRTIDGLETRPNMRITINVGKKN